MSAWLARAAALAALAAVCAWPACARPDAPGSARAAVLWFGGDAHVGAALPRLFATRPPALLRGATGVVNLEGPAVAHVMEAIDARHLVNAAAALDALRAGGVRVLTLANNHARDQGPTGPATTQSLVRRAGFEVAGGPAGDAVLVRDGLRVVLAPRDLTDGVPADLASDLAAARRRGDALVVAFHVTAPPSYLPSAPLRSATAIALEAGASVVVSHGTHAVASVERRGRAVVAWGLGNLVFGCACGDGTEGLLLRVALDARGAQRAAVLPIEAGLHGAPAVALGARGATLDLLAALGGARLMRDDGGAGWF